MKILIPIYDAQTAKSILLFIAHYFGQRTLNLKIVTVISGHNEGSGRERRKALRLLESTALSAGKNTATFEILTGNANEQILLKARTWEADLIIAGIHSSKAHDSADGEVRALLNHSDCPVMLLRPMANVNEGTKGKILIAVNEHQSSDDLANLITLYDLPLTHDVKLVTVVEAKSAISRILPQWCDLYNDQLEKRRARMRQIALQLRDHYHLPNIEELVLVGSARKCLVELAREWQPDLLIVGCHRSTGQPGNHYNAPGAVPLDILDDAPCSILIMNERLPLQAAAI